MTKVKITLTKSLSNRPKRAKSTVFALGLNKVGSEVELEGTPQVMGMLGKVKHLVKIESK